MTKFCLRALLPLEFFYQTLQLDTNQSIENTFISNFNLLHLDYSKQYLPPLQPQLLHWTCNVVLPYVIIITDQSPPLSWQVVAGRRNVAKGSENGKRTDSEKSKEYQLTNILFSLLPAQLFSVRNAECIEESLSSPQTKTTSKKRQQCIGMGLL